jgi:hypothetical protein
MIIQDLLKMNMSECVEWLIENQHDFELTKKPMFNSVEAFEDAVGYKANSSFREGFGTATMPDQ